VAKPPAIRSIESSKKICMCIYGPPGAGKTRLVGTGGEGTLIVRPPTDHTDSIRTTGVEEWEVHDWSEMINVHEYLRHDGAKDFDWVWLDSISLFQDTGLDDIWAGVIAAKPHRAEWALDRGEYNVNMWRLQQWVRHVVGIPGFHFGVTAHPAELANPITGEMKLQPWVQGRNMSQKVQGYMNIVAYLEVVIDKDGNERRVLRSRGTEQYEAKDQFDAFQDGKMADPTIEKIEDAILAVKRPARPKRRTRKAA
jgi:AAA domain